MRTYKNCQSCGMPMKKDPKGGGTQFDGTISKMYCSYCYQQGEFTQPDFSALEMQQFVKEKLKEMKFPAFLAYLFTRHIPNLKRWSS